jgi:hypothetical protein
LLGSRRLTWKTRSAALTRSSSSSSAHRGSMSE